ncbi:uncharacterized protein C12orf56 homolog isoform X2 [Channa argus]|uniref:uncharacterized protein C12orf56 homolog isoform X2 n=1 Tax=Channa argus TaxID=215402 RepID=UPI00294745BB|nr:hypothetical protein Q8A73_021880 [Channa argus]
MARTDSRTLSHPRNIKLDSFLRRNTDRTLYERIRACDPCVVVSETINKVYMHVVLTDEGLYVTEFAPRTLTVAVSFRRVRDIELVHDLPDFLSGKARECCQHIRIIYVTENTAGKVQDWLSRGKKEALPSSSTSFQKNSYCPSITRTFEGYPTQRNYSEHRKEVNLLKPTRSVSCPNPETLGLVRVPHPPTQPPSTAPSLYSSTSSPTLPPSVSEQNLRTTGSGQVPGRISSVLSHLLRRDIVNNEEEGEAELHLYAVSQTSRLYLHLQSSWNSFMIRSTLLLDPLYRPRSIGSPAISWERTGHLFSQLSSELLQDEISVETLYLLLQELRTAAQHNITLRRVFWRSSEVCIFLVQTLEDSLHNCQSPSGVYTADQLLLSILIIQTLSVMFRETEIEAARIDLLSAKKGALASRMLMALICDPKIKTHTQGTPTDSNLQALLSEYLDDACSLLFELLVLGHETSRCSSAENFLSVGWILQVLQPHPHLLSFIGYQAQQVVLVLSELQESILRPLQSVLLYQRCCLLLDCLQYNSQLAQYLRSHFREEFRYFVKPSGAQEKLLPCYPISKPTLRQVEHILKLMVHK